MEYTVNRLAQISGVSKRTLRYYDEIGLLRPERVNPNGYRIYGQMQVDSRMLWHGESGTCYQSAADPVLPRAGPAAGGNPGDYKKSRI